MDVAQAIGDAASLHTLANLTERFLQERDFSKFGVAYVRQDGNEFTEIVPLSNISEDFLISYAEQEYFLRDPLQQYCLRTTTPFVWDEVLALEHREPIVRQIYSEAADFGLPNGMTIPIRSLDGLHGTVTFGGPRETLGKKERLELNILALALHARVAELCDEVHVPSKGKRLSQREQETLKWGALGKTSEEIASILGLTKRTVDQHFENAGKKLGTVNRVHTVVQAFRHNLITL